MSELARIREDIEADARHLSHEASGQMTRHVRDVLLGVSARLIARCGELYELDASRSGTPAPPAIQKLVDGLERSGATLTFEAPSAIDAPTTSKCSACGCNTVNSCAFCGAALPSPAEEPSEEDWLAIECGVLAMLNVADSEFPDDPRALDHLRWAAIIIRRLASRVRSSGTSESEAVTDEARRRDWSSGFASGFANAEKGVRWSRQLVNDCFETMFPAAFRTEPAGHVSPNEEHAR